VPHAPVLLNEIGYGVLDQVRATRDALFALADALRSFSPRTIILSTPHNFFLENKIGVLTEPTLRGSFANFGFPEIKHKFENDLSLVSKLLNSPQTRKFLVPLESGELDHGALVFLDFFVRRGGSAKLVLLTASWGELKTFYDFGIALRDVLAQEDASYAYVASGDLSHCTRLTERGHFNEEGPLFDSLVIESVKKGSPEKLLNLDMRFLHRAEQCGVFSFLVAFGLSSDNASEGNVLSYEDPFGVGYLVGILRRNGCDFPLTT